MTENADIDKYRYSGYGIRFHAHGSFSFPGTGLGIKVIIFRVDMSSTTKIYKKKKDILIYFTEHNKRFSLSLCYNGANSYLFVDDIEIHKFKAKDFEIVATPLCLGNILKDWSVGNLKNTGLSGYVYDFSVDYNAIAGNDILDIQNYLMKKNDIV